MREAARRSGRTVEPLRLLAATKGVEAERIAEAIEAGVDAIGENRVQEAKEKLIRFRGAKPLHMIGHLQSNKARAAIELFDVIESVDSLELAGTLSRFSEQRGSPVEIYIEVNTSGEPEKYGVDPEKARELAVAASALPGLRVTGLMTVGPLSEDEGAVRSAFGRLRELGREIAGDLPSMEGAALSMGMSGDYEIAIEEGATLVRVGTGIFGPRRGAG